jgi:dihydropteroate synthase
MPQAPVWNCSNIKLDLSRPRVMGVLNVTPDSFSDGGTHNAPKAAIATAAKMLADGADLIDVGGESTRPGFTPVEPDEEFRRLEPVVRWLVQEGALVSIDTRHPSVAQRCVELGAHIINDVTGFSDPQMVQMAASSACGCIVMHSGPVSGTATRSSAVMAKAGRDDLSDLMSNASAGSRAWEDEKDQPLLPSAGHVMGLLEGYLLDRASDLESHGVEASRICLDPGVGFGKSPEDNIVILRATHRLANLGYPLMCAVSRKRFVGTVSGVADAVKRDDATIGISLAAVAAGARVLRVHDVPGMAQALDGFWAASEAWTSHVVLLLSPAADKDAHEVVKAVDAMPLTRVRTARETGDKLQLEVETALGRIPFQHALDAAIKGIATSK